MNTAIELVSHDRTAHADDVFAASILRIIYPQLTVTRTRDPAILRAKSGQPGVFFLDVGGRYDPELRLFDHHQPEGAGFRTYPPSPRDSKEQQWPYATAGLVWKHYGAQAVMALHPQLSEADVGEVVRYIDDAVLRYVDAVDCGVKIKSAGPSLSAMIASFNSSWYEQEEEIFPLVLELAQVVLTNFIKRYAGKILARERVRSSVVSADSPILILDACLPWGGVVAGEMPDVLIVVYPVAVNGLEAQWQLRTAVNSDMTPRIKLPQHWAGLDGPRFKVASGVESGVFCHRSRHLAGATSKEGALQLAAQAISQHQTDLAQAA